jgi:hypothetical protein
MKKDLCVVIQGPSSHVSDLKKSWEEYLPDVVFSTWKEDGISLLYQDSDVVIQNNIPSVFGIRNLNLQRISTFSGIKFAKENGYQRVLKIRSDMTPIAAKKFIGLFHGDDENSKKNFYAFSWINHKNGYYTDYFMCGDIASMEYVWDFDGTSSYDYPEQAITEKIKDLDKPIVECYHKMNYENDIFWHKYGGKMLKQTFNRY